MGIAGTGVARVAGCGIVDHAIESYALRALAAACAGWGQSSAFPRMSAAGKFMEWLAHPKDSSVSMVLEKVLREQLEKYGRVLDLKLDSRHSTVRFEVLLKGERDPITIFVDEYQLVSEPPTVAVVVKRAAASREWITSVLNDFIVGRPFPIPEKYAGLSKMLL